MGRQAERSLGRLIAAQIMGVIDRSRTHGFQGSILVGAHSHALFFLYAHAYFEFLSARKFLGAAAPYVQQIKECLTEESMYFAFHVLALVG
jgi:hypothetical protein